MFQNKGRPVQPMLTGLFNGFATVKPRLRTASCPNVSKQLKHKQVAFFAKKHSAEESLNYGDSSVANLVSSQATWKPLGSFTPCAVNDTGQTADPMTGKAG